LAAVPADADWQLEVPALEAVKPPPPPPPAKKPARARNAAPAARATNLPKGAVDVPSSVNGNAVLEIASRYIGVPYVYGGSSPSGFDCSGFTSYVYAQLGISLPRTAEAQRAAGTVISRDQARPGDLIYTPGHVAIYAGDNLMIDAARTGTTISFRKMYQSNPTFIRF
jgi:cell wall-associated NlpC family hydrolase